MRGYYTLAVACALIGAAVAIEDSLCQVSSQDLKEVLTSFKGEDAMEKLKATERLAAIVSACAQDGVSLLQMEESRPVKYAADTSELDKAKEATKAALASHDDALKAASAAGIKAPAPLSKETVLALTPLYTAPKVPVPVEKADSTKQKGNKTDEVKKEIIHNVWSWNYESIGDGYCSNWKYLPEGGYPNLLAEGSSLYDTDRIRECMNRCLDAYPGSTSFYVKTSDNNKCGCSSDHCSSRASSSAYTSFRILSKGGDKTECKACPAACMK